MVTLLRCFDDGVGPTRQLFLRCFDVQVTSPRLAFNCSCGVSKEAPERCAAIMETYYFFVADHHDEWDAFARPIPKGRQGFRSSLQSHLQRRSRKIKKKIENFSIHKKTTLSVRETFFRKWLK